MPEIKPHIDIAGCTHSQPFKSTLSVRRARPPERDRIKHADALLSQLENLEIERDELQLVRDFAGLPTDAGLLVSIHVSPPGSIDYARQLEWRREGIEVVSARLVNDVEIVNVFVPDGRLSAFERRIKAYKTENAKNKEGQDTGRPKNSALVDAIESFSRSLFAQLWTDGRDPPAADGGALWLQVWLRQGKSSPQKAYEQFVAVSETLEISVEPGYLVFPGRVVVAVRATRDALESATDVLDLIAEIRHVPATAEFFLSDLTPSEQSEWIESIQARTTFAGSEVETTPYIVILDTGVDTDHPLLASSIDSSDTHAVEAAWGVHDHYGHGTLMAGIATYGDLTPLLPSNEPIAIPHRLESVKIHPPTGHNAPHLYGVVTTRAIETVEQAAKRGSRTFLLMTTAEDVDEGKPSEWSATIDQLACGGANGHDTPDLEKSRLFVVAAGNVPWTYWHDYPAVNDLTPVQAPAQSWNAITVGACTSLEYIDGAKWPSLGALAPVGGLAPASTTSLVWSTNWPFKPDVVAEGGNGSLDTAFPSSAIVGPESLRLLTTRNSPATGLFAECGDTSAAAAEVARLCGHLSAHHPNYWPETVRALVVHGARHTPHMRTQLSEVPLSKEKRRLLRRYGYGQINFERSLVSTARRPTLVLQEVITPYEKKNGSVQLGALNMHTLPWPRDVLIDNAGVSVNLKVTLSYFVEPNPSRRGWQSKFRYQSHGLRFAVKGATETEQRFRQRINKLEREEAELGEMDAMSDPDGSNWSLGAQLRSRGSLHSDTWFGTAAQLSEKSEIAVFPVGGWWKDWTDAERAGSIARYALVVTLDVIDDVDVDIYTPIAVAIQAPVTVSVEGP